MQDYVLILAARQSTSMAEYLLEPKDKIINIVGLMNRPQTEILIILKKRPEWMAGLYNLPGGKIEPGETPIQAAHREFLEETGYTCTEMLPRGRMIDNGSVIHCFAAISSEFGEIINPRSEEDELLKWHYWCRSQNIRNLIPNLKVLVPLMLAGIHDFVIEDPKPSGNATRHSIRLSVPASKY